MDEINKKIIRELERNGRISNSELAERINLSPSACLRRVQELEKRGVISGYRAIINRDLIGRQMVVFVAVGLREHGHQPAIEFEQAMQDASEVTECHNVTGSFEYLLKVEVADLESYRRFHANILGELPQVQSITSHICLTTAKGDGL